MTQSASQALLTEGLEFHRNGALDQAAQRYRSVLSAEPARLDALELMTTLLAQQGRAFEALAYLEKAQALTPGRPEPYNLQGIALMGTGQLEAALAAFERAAALEPGFAKAWFHHGLTAAQLQQHAVALASLDRVIALEPGHAGAHLHRGKALLELGRAPEAISALTQAVALLPDRAEAHLNLAIALLRCERPADALPHLESALQLQPESPAALEHLGHAQRLLGHSDAALASYDKAIAASPAHPRPLEVKGKLLIELGRLDEARDLIRRAIERDPRNGGFYHTLAGLKQFTADDPDLVAMVTLLDSVETLPPDGQIELHFALGKAFADARQHERSFQHLLQANALVRRQFDFDVEAVLREFERCRSLITRDMVAKRAGWGDPSAVPVIVLGMPRSGTSLVEQILASHPRVYGAGERTDFDNQLQRLITRDRTSYPALVPGLSRDDIRGLGAGYRQSLTALSPQSDRIVDKLPGNFAYAGLIHMALPNARIIHTTRNAIDTCLSCFSIRFGGHQPFTYDLAELGRYYRGYETLMAHWRNILPDGVIIDVAYEDVVADVETQARRIVAHCGLEWNDACLSFYDTARSVRTASAAQVRRPIYGTSVARWRPYQDQLKPLFDALGLLPDGSEPER